jgi:hypothetical protein
MTGEAAEGANVEARNLNPGPTGVATLLPERSVKRTTAGFDGSFEITDVIPGSYSVTAWLPASSRVYKNIEVSDRTADLDIAFPRAVFSASILWEDGSPVSTPVITEVVSATISPGPLHDNYLFGCFGRHIQGAS